MFKKISKLYIIYKYNNLVNIYFNIAHVMLTL